MGLQIETGTLGFLGFFFLILIWIASVPDLGLSQGCWDIFFRHNLSGWAKAGWYVARSSSLPVRSGPLVYSHRQAQSREPEEARWASQVEGSSPGPAQELETLAKLKESGHITEEEFQAQKTKLLGP